MPSLGRFQRAADAGKPPLPSSLPHPPKFSPFSRSGVNSVPKMRHGLHGSADGSTVLETWLHPALPQCFCVLVVTRLAHASPHADND